MKAGYWLVLLILSARVLYAQEVRDTTLTPIGAIMQSHNDSINKQKERDITDLLRRLTNRNPELPAYQSKKDKTEFTLVPAGGYTLQTGFTILLAANLVLYSNQKDETKSSTIFSSLSYTQYDQIILPVYANIWTKNKKYNIVSDMRYMSYPSETFGLGAHSKKEDGYSIDFNYLKIHPALLRSISPNLFVGVGYYFDHFWNEHEINPNKTPTSFQEYGLHKEDVASGVTFQGLYDSRGNSINPIGGIYSSLRYRINDKWMGSTSAWQSGIFEWRKYLRFPQHSENIIALWNYNWLTLSGNPPYLLLPSTGWDDFFNTGRGYIQGRYRAKNMSYVEAEYRFRLIENGILGAVVFANVQTFSGGIVNLYKTIMPGAGAGLRIKVNKHSRTNLCIDYAFGLEGSRGFFINLGEVF